MEDPSPVIAYKPCGKKDEKYPLLKEENFLVIIMTNFQCLQSFLHLVVLILLTKEMSMGTN